MDHYKILFIILILFNITNCLGFKNLKQFRFKNFKLSLGFPNQKNTTVKSNNEWDNIGNKQKKFNMTNLPLKTNSKYIINNDNIKLINLESNNFDKPFYFIIKNINKINLLINDMIKANVCGIFISKLYYTKKEIKDIIKNYISNKSKINSNDILVYDDSKYIGGSFELYSLLFT